jgi:hypothetical protein
MKHNGSISPQGRSSESLKIEITSVMKFVNANFHVLFHRFAPQSINTRSKSPTRGHHQSHHSIQSAATFSLCVSRGVNSRFQGMIRAGKINGRVDIKLGVMFPQAIRRRLLCSVSMHEIASCTRVGPHRPARLSRNKHRFPKAWAVIVLHAHCCWTFGPSADSILPKGQSVHFHAHGNTFFIVFSFFRRSVSVSNGLQFVCSLRPALSQRLK